MRGWGFFLRACADSELYMCPAVILYLCILRLRRPTSFESVKIALKISRLQLPQLQDAGQATSLAFPCHRPHVRPGHPLHLAPHVAWLVPCLSPARAHGGIRGILNHMTNQSCSFTFICIWAVKGIDMARRLCDGSGMRAATARNPRGLLFPIPYLQLLGWLMLEGEAKIARLRCPLPC